MLSSYFVDKEISVSHLKFFCFSFFKQHKNKTQLTLLNLVGVPRLWGGCAFLYKMVIEPPCMPALTRWITRQDVVVIFLREALK